MREKITPALAFHTLTPLFDKASELLGFGNSFRKRVVDMAEIKDGERILDVGCGTGSLLIEIKNKYPKAEVVGIDPDPNILHIAHNKLEQAGVNAQLKQGVVQELPFPTSSFDLVTSTLVFHHLPTEVKRQAIKEIYRVLKENGRFLLADFGKPETMLSYVLLNLGSIFDGRNNMRANLGGKLPSFLQEAGFQVTDFGRRYRGVQFLLARKRKI